MFSKRMREKLLAQKQQQEVQQKQQESATRPKRKWVLPVAIVGGVAIVGTILYFVLRKK
jgi:hypothetical protein